MGGEQICRGGEGPLHPPCYRPGEA